MYLTWTNKHNEEVESALREEVYGRLTRVFASREATSPSATLETSLMLSKSSYAAHYCLPRLVLMCLL